MGKIRGWFASYWDSMLVAFLVILFSVLFDGLFVLRYFKHTVSFPGNTYSLFAPEFIDVMPAAFICFLIRNLLVVLSVPFFIYAAKRSREGSTTYSLQWFGFLGLYIYLFSYNTFFYFSSFFPYVSLLSIISIVIVVISLISFIRKYRSEVRDVEYQFNADTPYKSTIAYLCYKMVGVALVLLATISGIRNSGVPHPEPIRTTFYIGVTIVFFIVMVIYILIITQMVRKRDQGSTLAVMVLTNDKIPDFPTLFLFSHIILFIIFYLVPGFLLKRYTKDLMSIRRGAVVP